jgi:hypothetical protein
MRPRGLAMGDPHTMRIWARKAIVGLCWSAAVAGLAWSAAPADRPPAANEQPPKPGPAVDAAIADRARAMEQQYGIRIQYEYVPGTSIPDVWRDTIVGTQVSPEHAAIMLDEIDHFMRVVPRAVIEKNLDAIHLFNRVLIHGRATGAMVYGRTICLCAGPASHIRNCLFHEFAHILQVAYPIDMDTWMAALPEGFKYYGQGNEMIVAGVNPFETGEELWSEGFVLLYSKASLSEDFAVFSDYLFSRPEQTLEWAKKYPAMRKRVATLIRHYQSISPDYDFSAYEEVLQGEG